MNFYKNYYYLFGEEAVKQYESGEVVTTIEGCVFKFKPRKMHPSNLLEAFSGWGLYVNISTVDYIKLKNHFEYCKLPDDYWDVITEHLPNYQTRTDILFNDKLSCYLNYELENDSEDVEWIKSAVGSLHLKNCQEFYEKDCVRLYKEALENVPAF